MRTPLSLLLTLVMCVAISGQTKPPAPVIRTIAQGVISRHSEKQDENGINQPPWTKVTVENVFGFKRQPVIGEAVTVIAIGSEISPFDLRILKAELKEDLCDESLPRVWEVELEPVREKTFFEVASPVHRNAEFPFDAVILFPAVKFARQLKTEDLKLSSLPKGIYLETVKAAIDLDNDRSPDVLVVEYCCLDKKKAPGECDLTCSKTFSKVRNVWKLVDTSSPC